MKKVLNFTTALIFVIYLLLILYFTLFDYAFGRNIFNIFNWSVTNFREYAESSLNLVPFGTIKLMINGLISENITTKYFIINILGNFFILSPLGYFLPKLYNNINKFWKFVFIIAGISLLIEILQLIFLTGSCDIDDFIFNLGGAMIGYALVCIPFVRKIVHVIGLENNEQT